MSTIRIRYLGSKLPKIVELPVPLKFKSDKTGEVVCDPIGEFPAEDGERLLAIGGMFVREDGEPNFGPLCVCGCGDSIVILPIHAKRGVPRYIRGHYKPILPTFPKPSEAEKELAVSADS